MKTLSDQKLSNVKTADLTYRRDRLAHKIEMAIRDGMHPSRLVGAYNLLREMDAEVDSR